MFKLPVVVAFGSMGSLASTHLSIFLGSEEHFRIDDRIFTIELVGQHSVILMAKAFVEVMPLHPLPHAPVGFYWDTPSGVSGPVEIGAHQTHPHSLPFPA